MVTRETLGEGVPFNAVYLPRRLIIVDGKTRNDTMSQDFDLSLVRLWRYMPEKTETIKKYSFWSELETEHPNLVSKATGIDPGRCVWRAEWTFPLVDALAYLDIGGVRFCDVGAFREYSNKSSIPADQFTWSKMRD